MHGVKSFVHLRQLEVVCHKLINLHLVVQVVFHQHGHTVARFVPTESATSPDAACDQLEWTRAYFLSTCSHTNNS